MFRFNEVKVNGKLYYIDKAVLDNGDGLDVDTEGVNWYEIDLQPYDEDVAPICGIDLVISNSGECVAITKNLDRNSYSYENGIEHINTTDCLIDGNTIIVPDEKTSEKTAVEIKTLWSDGTEIEDVYMDIESIIEELSELSQVLHSNSGEQSEVREISINGVISNELA